jgi:creatinine amidohydrolase
MRIRDLNWMQVEAYLAEDDRIVLPVGSTEQHAYLSLETDNILAERASLEAAEPLGIPVLPVMPFGVTGFTAYPGSPSLTESTLVAVVSEVVESLLGQGFARILVVNGHGGNTEPGRAWTMTRADRAVVWHELWEGRPDEIAAEIDPDFDHASWSENFPWTRLEGVSMPDERKPPVVWPEDERGPWAVRRALGDGSFGGLYQRSPEDESRLWNAAVEAIRSRLEKWGED